VRSVGLSWGLRGRMVEGWWDGVYGMGRLNGGLCL
jgi:hypothetical protein